METTHWAQRLAESVRQLFLRAFSTKPGDRIGKQERRDPLAAEAKEALLARRRDDNVGGEGG